MALNINPQERADGHEIAGLVYWNIPWVQGIAALLLLIGVQHTVFHFDNAIRLTLSLVFILAAFNLVTLFLSEKKYVNSEKEGDLALTLSALGNFWRTYAVVLIFSLGSLVNTAGKGGYFYLIPLIVAVFLLVSFVKEKKRMGSVTDLTQCISSFAKGNVNQVRFVAFFSFLVGFAFLVLYLLSFFIKIAVSETTCLLWSASYIGIGTGARLYWLKVRDICRNPSVIYFERSLERLNLYWLLFGIFSIIQCVANFF